MTLWWELRTTGCILFILLDARIVVSVCEAQSVAYSLLSVERIASRLR